MQMDKRGNERRDRDLRGAVQHCAHQRLPHGQVAMRVLDLHRRVVDQDADGQRQSPSVITLMVWPSRLRMQMEVRIESGIEMHTISVLRQLPRNSRITMPVRDGGNQRLAHHAADRGPHEQRLIAEHRQLQVLA